MMDTSKPGSAAVYASWRVCIWIAVVVGFALLAAILMTRTGGMRQRPAPTGITSSQFGPAEVVASVRPEQLAGHLDVLSRWPSRLPGTSGHQAAARYVQETFTELGLTVMRQPIEVTVPLTRYCQLLGPDDRPLEDLSLHPLWPNLVRTCTIPEPGIQGRAMQGQAGGAHLYEFDGLDPARTVPIVPISCTEEWIGLADAGFPAVIFYIDPGARPRHHRRKELDFPGNFPRFLLVGDPDALHGRQVRIRCRVDWQTVQADQIVAVAEPPAAAGDGARREAVILTAHYDSISTVPDLAPGAEEAASLGAMLAVAQMAAEHRDHLRRTMVFIALTGHGQAARGVRLLAKLWGQPGDEAHVRQRLIDRLAGLAHRLKLLDGQGQVLLDEAYWQITGQDRQEAERSYWTSQPPDLEAALVENVRRLIEQKVGEAQEQLIQRDLARQAADADSQAVQAYHESRRHVEQLRQAGTSTLLDLKTFRGLGDEHMWLEPLRRRVALRRSKIEKTIDRLEQSLKVQKLLHRFDRHIVFCLAVTTGAPGSSVFASYPNSRRSSDGAAGWFGDIAAELTSRLVPQAAALAQVDPQDRAGHEFAMVELFKDGVNGNVPYPEPSLRAGSMNYELAFSYEYLPLVGEGRHAVAWVSLQDSAPHMGTPEDTFDRLDRKNLVLATRFIAAGTMQMGAGLVELNATAHMPRTKSARGRVLMAADPNSVIPTRGIEGALVVARHRNPRKVASVRQEDMVVSAEDGSFLFPPNDRIKPPEDFQAFRIDPQTGRIFAVKDQGEKGEGSYPTARHANNFDNPLRLVMFRCAQTDLFYPLHPSSSIGLGSAFCVDARTLASPISSAVLSGNPFGVLYRHWWRQLHEIPAQGFSLFNPPATTLYVGLRSQSPLDAAIQTVVAYLVGGEPLAPEPPEGRQVWGPGYLAHATPLLRLWPRHAALSMAAFNGYRLGRQQAHRVADPVLVQQHQMAASLSAAANQRLAAGQHTAALHAAQDALAISMEVYPRIGQTQRDAVIGVVFYLFLVIPFAIFVERLLFGFADIRWQITGVVGIFAAVFLALRYLHPAFELVSSALMVLIGFLTLAMSLMVTVYLLGKFRANMKQLRLRWQRTAEAADVSRAAAAAAAFGLGINNMRKRKVRTCFTCITLILVTFSLLSLTAVRRESRFKRIAIGPAPYTGILITGPNRDPLPGTAALIERFGKDAGVSRLQWANGGMGLSRGAPGQAGTDKIPYFRFSSAIGMDPEEVNVTDVTAALVCGRWFTSDSERACILPTNFAKMLEVTNQMAEAGQTTVYVDGRPVKVVGIFDPKKFEQVYDLDGQNLLNVDRSQVRRFSRQRKSLGSQIKAPDQLPRVRSDDVLLLPTQEAGGVVARLAVNLGALPPVEAMGHITDFLKRWEGFVYYGIGGIAYYGRIYRGTQVEGLAEILIPLLIAGAIVLNTMLGSVYERIGEIGVYSAVGLSPAHVRYLFLAEACVYATVGAVAGYLLAHGIGTLLSVLDLTGGLSFNYSTLATVYATLVMVVVVLLSTWYPARKAAKLASPSQASSIKVPVPRGELMQVALPFTYVELDAISVIPFLYDVLENHGEGSSGPFFCAAPQMVRHDQLPAELDGRRRGFGLQARCWLRPFDLGVSQMMTLAICPTALASVWSAHLHLVRLSGEVEAWRRTNQVFLTALRRHFLAWRGIDQQQKDDYLVRGLAALEVQIEHYLAG